MSDPRIKIINKRLQKIKKIVAVSSGKGGVGKSMVSATLAVTLARKGFRVGLFDLDFTSPSTHIILDVENKFPQEDKGLIPPFVHGINYMSLIYYSGDNPAPLRGVDVSNTLIELLSVTLWNELDYLVIDMPPGIGDLVLDVIRLIDKIEFLIITTSSRLAFETVKKQVNLLSLLKKPIIGIIENMAIESSNYVKQQSSQINLNYLIKILYDTDLELTIGNPQKLQKTFFAKKIEEITHKL